MFFGTVEVFVRGGGRTSKVIRWWRRTLFGTSRRNPPPARGSSGHRLTNYFLRRQRNQCRPYIPVTRLSVRRSDGSRMYVDPKHAAGPRRAREQGHSGTRGGRVRALSYRFPNGLAVARDLIMIYSEVKVLYTPTVGYVMRSGIDLRPMSPVPARGQAACVIYPASAYPAGATPPCSTRLTFARRPDCGWPKKTPYRQNKKGAAGGQRDLFSCSGLVWAGFSFRALAGGASFSRRRGRLSRRLARAARSATTR